MATVIDGTTGVTFPAGGLGNPAGAVVGTTDTQTLTNKTIQGGTLTLATAQTAPPPTPQYFDFTGIPSWAKRITVMFSGVSTNGTSRTIIQLGDSGGFETTGYLGSSLVGGSATPSTTAFTDGFGINFFAAGNLVHGSMIISLLDASTNTWVNSHVFGLSDGAFIVTGGASKSLSAALTQIRITTQAGTNTFDAGTINIMYEG